MKGSDVIAEHHKRSALRRLCLLSPRVQNHIKGVHACGMALLAESATGAAFGMNLPDEALPLLKSMSIDYVRVAKGDLRAIATLTEVSLASKCAPNLHAREPARPCILNREGSIKLCTDGLGGYPSGKDSCPSVLTSCMP